VQVLYDIRELYVNNLASLLREFGDGSLQQDIAEVLYAKTPERTVRTLVAFVQESKRCPISVRGCISKIPMAAASRDCLVHADTEPGRPENCSLASRQLPLRTGR